MAKCNLFVLWDCAIIIRTYQDGGGGGGLKNGLHVGNYPLLKY